MILMCHQPNFLPYLGYFYKLYKCDVYSVSDTCGFTNHKENGIHNYNFINEFGSRNKLSLPVDRHSGRLCDVLIADTWEKEKEKFLKRIWYAYHKAPHFEEVWADLEPLFNKIKAGDKMVDWNLYFTVFICKKMGMLRELAFESLEGDELPTDPDEAIIYMCKRTGCDKYLVGIHGNQYMDVKKYKENGIELVYSDFDDEKDLTHNKLSILDYIMNYGYVIPKEWN